METSIQLISGSFAGGFETYTINGKDIKIENTFESPFEVITREGTFEASGTVIKYAFEPHSVTALISNIY
jgi:alpha-N-arabinofuranosidase